MFSEDNNQFDVIIVGAGPAGASCAFMLRQSGLKVAVLDKTSFPRDKTCGDALSLDVVIQLERMDKTLSEKFEKLAEKAPSFGVSIFSPGGFKVEMPIYKNGEKKCGYVCERYVFDNFLFEQLQGHENIHVFTNTTVTDVHLHQEGVTVETDQGTLHAKLLLGADGAHSVINKKTGAIPVDKDHYCAGLRQYYENVEGFNEGNFIELYFFRELLPGYLWVFKLPGGKANVGLGILSSEVTKKKINIKETFRRLMETNPSLKKRFENAKPLESIKGYGLPLGSKKRQLSGNRYLLLGDAASLIDPFSGEGIANAIRSGRVAAEVVEECFNINKFDAAFLKRYDKELYRRIWMELKVSKQLQNLCRYPRLFDFIVRRVEQSDYLKEFMNEALKNVHKKKILTGPLFFYHLFFKKNNATTSRSIPNKELVN